MVLPVGIPDILAHTRLGRAQAETRRALDVAQREMVTGEAVDRFKATGGDTARLMAFDRGIAVLDNRKPLLAMAGTRSAAMQDALGGVQAATEGLGVRMLRDISMGDFSSARFAAGEARTALGQVMMALNTEHGSRQLFAGGSVGAPLAPAADLLAAVAAALDGVDLDDPDAIVAAVTAYFDPDAPAVLPEPPDPPEPANFNSDGQYRGAPDAGPPVEIADGEYLAYGIRADDPVLREMMRGLSLAAVADDRYKAGDISRATLETLLDEAGRTVIAATDSVTALRSRLGTAEQRIEAASARTAAQRDTLERGRADLIGRDPYETASRVVELQSQLEAIYAITARSSQLSLLNFLR